MDLKKKKLISFHALPIGQGRSIKDSLLHDKYIELLGEEALNSEVTYSGKILDNPVLPFDVLKESEELTAKAFGSNETLYITMGTTMANYISLISLCESNDPVLVDKNCHQSVHFALKINKNKVEYSENQYQFKDSGRNIMNVEQFLEKYKSAYLSGNPYKLVVLNGCSYEGVIYENYQIIEECIAINDDCHFLIDEAWFSYGHFHPYYKKYSAMNIAANLSHKYPTKNISIISTQSAHKSLSSLRQGSLIHIYSDSKTISKVKNTKYMLHTTSPSYAILCSLELARVQMVNEGHQLIETALDYSREITNYIQTLSCCSMNNEQQGYYYKLDPLKLSINFKEMDMPTEYIKEFLLNQNIYVNRKTETSILFNFHIGLRRADINKMLHTFAELEELEFYWMKNKIIQQEVPKDSSTIGKPVDYFLIQYPPGVPLLVPGDIYNSDISSEIETLTNRGVSLIKTTV